MFGAKGMHAAHRTTGLALAGAVILLGAAAHAAATAPLQTEVYRRAKTEFAQACFFKPVESKPDDLAFKLAPLLIEEVPGSGAHASAPPAMSGLEGTNQPGCRNTFGALVTRDGRLEADLSRPTVYVHSDTLQIQDSTHPRLTYLWFAPAESNIVAAQGIRITLNSFGNPAAWEVLTDSSGLRIVFVSQNVESAAAAQFGLPLPGRRYSTEGPTTARGDVVVARVIDDAAVTMGPILYLRTGVRQLATLICRCMPAQVKQLAGTGGYQLEPWAGQMPLKPVSACFWPGLPENGVDALRLPNKF